MAQFNDMNVDRATAASSKNINSIGKKERSGFYSGGTHKASNGETSGNIDTRESLHDFSDSKELRIPVAYGFIAAKEWGPSTGCPVLGLHGWQDNAGTFDLLVSHLPASIHLVVIDFPGHGLSSHIPKGAMYSLMQYIMDIRRVCDFLKWHKFSILAHSLGAIIGVYYSAIFPESVEKLVSLDILNPGIRPKDSGTIRKFVESFLLEEVKEEIPDSPRPEKDALEMMWKRREGLSMTGAIPLFQRGTVRKENGFVFTRDHRLKAFLLQPWEFSSEDAAIIVLQNVKVDMLVLVASESKLAKFPEDLQNKIKELYKKNCRSFQYVEVEGTHFVHLNDPALIAPHISKFLCNNEKPISKAKITEIQEKN